MDPQSLPVGVHKLLGVDDPSPPRTGMTPEHSPLGAPQPARAALARMADAAVLRCTETRLCSGLLYIWGGSDRLEDVAAQIRTGQHVVDALDVSIRQSLAQEPELAGAGLAVPRRHTEDGA